MPIGLTRSLMGRQSHRQQRFAKRASVVELLAFLQESKVTGRRGTGTQAAKAWWLVLVMNRVENLIQC